VCIDNIIIAPLCAFPKTPLATANYLEGLIKFIKFIDWAKVLHETRILNRDGSIIKEKLFRQEATYKRTRTGDYSKKSLPTFSRKLSESNFLAKPYVV
jgi:hypothetical protein